MTPIEKLRTLIQRSGVPAAKLAKTAGYKDQSIFEQIKKGELPSKEALAPLLSILKTSYEDITTEKAENADVLAAELYENMKVYVTYCSNPDKNSASKQAVDAAKFKFNLTGPQIKQAYRIAGQLYSSVVRDVKSGR